MNKPDSALRVELRQSSPIPLDARFSCEAGQILALVGPSGSGKSTILRSIAGIYTPETGKISCAGEDWLDTARGLNVKTRLRSVGFVFQSYALFPHLSALHNVMEALSHIPASERANRARAFLARTHLDGLEGRRPAELSGGQQQRVAVARALARDPKVLLLDEPFSAVDQVTRERLYEDLVAQRGELRVPMVLVTHALDEAAMLADRMCVLHRGQTLQIGAPYEVMTRPAGVLVAGVLGLKNVFAAEVLQHDEERAVTRLQWGDVMLNARLNASIPKGSRVSWFVPQSQIVLHRPDHPRQPDLETHVAGVIARCVPLRETTNIQLAVSAVPEAMLSFSIPTRIAQSNGLATGLAITVALLADGIHLMPQDQGGRDEGGSTAGGL
ncbi:MAG TPA: ABC transporter ATP-binding protein [Aggregatilineaceae bacterium]|nr:ABC transporter ATP-binding protein [Aggregatilineaceae bacterium]